MKIEFENLGCIEQGSVELNDFTIFCGQNNSGKTYAMYSIYALFAGRFHITVHLDFVKPIIKTLKETGSYCIDIAEILAKYKTDMLHYIEKNFNRNLPKLFGVHKEYFLNTKIKLLFDVSNDEILEKIKQGVFFGDKMTFSSSIGEWTWEVNSSEAKIYLEILKTSSMIEHSLHYGISKNLVWSIFSGWLFSYNEFDKKYFLLPAERAGIDIFFKELFSIRNLLLQESQNDNVDPMRLLNDVLQARYAQPIKDYLQFLNQIGTTKNDTSSYIQYAETVEKEIVKGKYTVNDFGNIFFTPSETKNQLPLHFCSSTVKSLFGLAFYLEHLAWKGDYLMIDEPELNLHPDNQRQVARLLAQLVNAGLKVIVSTHSDYFVRELNNLIMLKKDFTGAKELQEKYGYQDNELLDGKRVSAYLFYKNKIEKMKIDDEGIIADTFDNVINELNQSSNEIYFTMQDAKEIDVE
jgi:hypothetical protein